MRSRRRAIYLDALAVRPVLMVCSLRTADTMEVSLSFARFAIAARRISLFFAGMPASRHRFLRVAMRAYSPSGIVKLSRIRFAFFTLAGLPAFLPVTGKVSGAFFLAWAGFLRAGEGDVLCFAATAAALTGVGALLVAGAAVLAPRALAGADGLVLSVVSGAVMDVAGFEPVGFSVLSIMVISPKVESDISSLWDVL